MGSTLIAALPANDGPLYTATITSNLAQSQLTSQCFGEAMRRGFKLVATRHFGDGRQRRARELSCRTLICKE